MSDQTHEGFAHVPLRDLGEREFIRSVVEGVSVDVPSVNVLVGIGDDAAVFQLDDGRTQVITVDAMVEDTHFRRAAPAETVGYRLAVSNLSDIAAMGATPTVAVLTLAAPPDLDVEWLRGFYRGLRGAADRFRFALVGGDTVRADRVMASLTLLGVVDPGVVVPLRSAARAGDTIYVTGFPGESGAGMRLLEAPGLAARLTAKEANRLIGRHQWPTPRLLAGRALARSLDRVALVDISDGVFNETELITEASGGLGAEIELARLPVSPELAAFAVAGETRPHRLVLYGGEDYELLFACAAPRREIEAILRAEGEEVALQAIGHIRAMPGVDLLDEQGKVIDEDHDVFRHF
jgi:thiamine-monophosphate kinase